MNLTGGYLGSIAHHNLRAAIKGIDAPAQTNTLALSQLQVVVGQRERYGIEGGPTRIKIDEIGALCLIGIIDCTTYAYRLTNMLRRFFVSDAGRPDHGRRWAQRQQWRLHRKGGI